MVHMGQIAARGESLNLTFYLALGVMTWLTRERPIEEVFIKQTPRVPLGGRVRH